MSLEPMSLPDIWKDIRTVASALGAPERGDQLVTRLVERLDAVQALAASGRTRPSIACIEWIDPLMGAGNWVPELVDRAGGTDLLGKAGEHFRRSHHRAARRRRPRRDRDHAVRIRHRAFLPGNDAPGDSPALAAAFRGREPPRVHDGREPVLQPAGAARCGIGGDSGGDSESGGLRLRSSRAWLELLDGRCERLSAKGGLGCARAAGTSASCVPARTRTTIGANVLRPTHATRSIRACRCCGATDTTRSSPGRLGNRSPGRPFWQGPPERRGHPPARSAATVSAGARCHRAAYADVPRPAPNGAAGLLRWWRCRQGRRFP